jgi:DNA-binding NtrC family response regulator
MASTILVVEDDPAQLRFLEMMVQRMGYRVITAPGGPEALEILMGPDREQVDLVVLDLVMPELDGIGLLEKVHPVHPALPMIVLTMKGGVETVVNVMRAGAVDFVIKPASPERMQVSIENALKISALSGEVSRLTRRADGTLGFADIIGSSPAMRRALDLAQRAADSTIPILVEGESGVGKELIARAIQGVGERAGRAFVTVNCGAIPENLVESILFGHEKGSFTGADQKHIGKFQEADGGTLFLDEIGELRADLQVKLLRALQEGEVDPIGAKKPINVDVRLISATNRDLAQLVTEGTFREDLYYRLNVFPIHVPPLKERKDDIAELVDRFISNYASSEGKSVRSVTAESLEMLIAYDWPGNVRQLENAVFRAVVLCDGDFLDIADFPHIAQAQGVAAPGTATATITELPPDIILTANEEGRGRELKEIESDAIRLSLERCKGQMSEAARQLGIGRSTLYRKVRQYGLDECSVE